MERCANYNAVLVLSSLTFVVVVLFAILWPLRKRINKACKPLIQRTNKRVRRLVKRWEKTLKSQGPERSSTNDENPTEISREQQRPVYAVVNKKSNSQPVTKNDADSSSSSSSSSDGSIPDEHLAVVELHGYQTVDLMPYASEEKKTSKDIEYDDYAEISERVEVIDQARGRSNTYDRVSHEPETV